MKWQDLGKNKLAQEKLNTRNKKYSYLYFVDFQNTTIDKVSTVPFTCQFICIVETFASLCALKTLIWILKSSADCQELKQKKKKSLDITLKNCARWYKGLS